MHSTHVNTAHMLRFPVKVTTLNAANLYFDSPADVSQPYIHSFLVQSSQFPSRVLPESSVDFGYFLLQRSYPHGRRLLSNAAFTLKCIPFQGLSDSFSVFQRDAMSYPIRENRQDRRHLDVWLNFFRYYLHHATVSLPFNLMLPSYDYIGCASPLEVEEIKVSDAPEWISFFIFRPPEPGVMDSNRSKSARKEIKQKSNHSQVFITIYKYNPLFNLLNKPVPFRNT